MRNTKKVALVKGRRLRVTRLDACGRPVYGDDAVATSKGFISVSYTARTNESDAIQVTNAAGEIIVEEASVATLSGYGVEMIFGEVDPDLFSLITGQNVVRDADDNAVGFDIDTAVVLTGSGFALEVWAGSPAGDACADEASEGSYGYVLIPFLQGGILGDFTIENGGISFTITGANSKDGNSWGVGPYNVMLNGGTPGPMLEPVSSTTALRVLLVDVAPPAPLTGTRPLLDDEEAALTSLSATIAGMDVTFAGLPDPAAGVGIWYDFGDGTWDFAETDVVHTYTTAGTYTASASTNGVWVTTSVTVPGA